MTDTATTPPASEDNPTPGSSGDGTGGGTQTGADTFAAEREQFESRVRSFQGEKDRAEARANGLQAELDALKSGNGGDGGGTPAPVFDADLIVSNLEERLVRRQELSTAASTLKSEFDLADPALFDPKKVAEFASVEAFKEAVESSHRVTASLVDARVATRESALRTEFAEKYGITLPPPASTGEAPSGDPTVDQIVAMSFSEKARYEAEHPGVMARVLRSAS